MAKRKKKYGKNSKKNCMNMNSDICGGFQDIDPMLLLVLFEIISNVISGIIPVNVANAFGNWLQLIAATIIMFNSQQEYHEEGPGRYYNPMNRNIDNPFCNQNNNDIDVDELYKEIKRLKREINKLKNKSP